MADQDISQIVKAKDGKRREAVDLEPTRISRSEDARDVLLRAADDIDVAAIDGEFMSASVRARKPRPAGSESGAA